MNNVVVKCVFMFCVVLSCVATTHAQVTDSKDIIATYGNDIDSLRNDLDKQAEIVKKIAADQQRDRTQILNVMESIVDRLDRVDKNMKNLEEKVNRIDIKN